MKNICSTVAGFTSLGYPVLMGEWSAGSGISAADWERKFYGAQAREYGRLAGSTFWSYLVKPSTVPDGLGLKPDQAQMWSWKDLHNAGVVPNPSPAQNTRSFLRSMPSAC